MKTEWQFFFRCEGLRFSKEQKYRGSARLMPNSSTSDAPPIEVSADVRIVPEKADNLRWDEQQGRIYITVPGRSSDTEHYIHLVAMQFAARVNFSAKAGTFEIQGGVLVWQHIPENTEEEVELDGKPYGAKLHFVEAIGPPIFDPALFVRTAGGNYDASLVAQHNAARQAMNPIDKCLGFVKILESQCSPPSKGDSLRTALLENEHVLQIFQRAFTFTNDTQAREHYKTFVTAVCAARNECAHLRLNPGFGYTPDDPRLATDVLPYLEALEILSSAIVENGERK